MNNFAITYKPNVYYSPKFNIKFQSMTTFFCIARYSLLIQLFSHFRDNKTYNASNIAGIHESIFIS